MMKFHVIAHIQTNEDGTQVYKRYGVKGLYFDVSGPVSCETFESTPGAADARNVDIRGERGFLIQSMETYDKEGIEIYQCDVLEDEAGKKWEVVKVCGSWGIVDEKGDFQILLDMVTRKMKSLGNRGENPTLGLKSPFEAPPVEGEKKEEEKPHEYLMGQK